MGIKVNRTVSKAQKQLQQLGHGIVEVGWFAEGAPAEDKLTAPQLAAILSYGAVLKGGQPYFFTKKGEIVFMKKSKDGTKPRGAMGITKPSYIPPRPMLSQAAQTYGDEWQQKARSIARGIIAGDASVQKGLENLGAKVAGDIKTTISSGAFAANTPLTIKKKEGREKPLIDTGGLMGKVTFKAQEGKRK